MTMNANNLTGKCDNGGKSEGEQKRAAIVSTTQKNMLIEFVQQNPELNNPKFSNRVTKASVEKLWDTITSILNVVPDGSVKTKAQWKRTWQDQKKVIKAKLAANNKNLKKTGGGPSENVNMSPEEEQKLTAIVPKIAVAGNEDIKESDTLFEDNELEPGNCRGLDGLEDFVNDEKDATILEKASGSAENAQLEIINVENDLSLFPALPADFSVLKHTVDLNTDGELNVAFPSSKVEVAKIEAELPMLKKQPLVQKTEPFSVKSENIGSGAGGDERKTLSLFPNKKRSMAVHRQDASLRNSENIIALSTDELETKMRYYDQKVFLLARQDRANQVQSRALNKLSNRLIYPW